ncbi:unnamed protein product (macronuclear) [Paramecium tetraurelia]|uniref:Uncharacterized protein n=1 Tax=Paramecium tetraurelia TaxID=5888 RepID=A0D1X7_PARTE|nr:uncharacterized protein GSPATT00039178001 [Paramecium tetraurelia]CAK77044.1 unnamed protein product [Paramecium tetraurelia]|eukprot:XP_001444441.1 hypothetical protein (macronuclear) [Paramecium tetraurelia strain d4-2]
MDIFKCKYLKHENEEIIGFCLNQNCQNTTQYCYKCLNTTHQDHINDCIRFTEIIQIMNESKQVYTQQMKQFKDIYKRIENLFEQFKKKMDQEIKTLENMTQQLKNQDYLTFKSQIHILKQFYSGEKKDYKCIRFQFIKETQIIQLHNINNTIKNMVSEQTQAGDQFDSGNENDIKIAGINFQTNSYQQLNIQEIEKLLNEGAVLKSLNKYQEAIECYDKVISINPKYYVSWNNKGTSLQSLKKFQDAIECFNQAISINPKYYVSWNNKGNALQNLTNYQEAIDCYEKAISINPKYDVAWNNMGNALSSLNKYQESIKCFDKAIFINPNNDLAWNNKGNQLQGIIVQAMHYKIQIFNKKQLNAMRKLFPQIQWQLAVRNYYSGTSLINLNKYQEAVVCFDKAFSINPKNENVWSNKGFALHNLKKYKDAIICYDKALSISITSLRLQRKADSLFELENKQEAKKAYLDALEKGSNNKNYIEKQLSKL